MREAQAIYSSYTPSAVGETEAIFKVMSSIPQQNELGGMYLTLNYNNPIIYQIAIQIINLALRQGKRNLAISKTGAGELLIYTENNGVYNNIIVDRDADIEYMHIPKDSRRAYNEYYYHNDQINPQLLAAKL